MARKPPRDNVMITLTLSGGGGTTPEPLLEHQATNHRWPPSAAVGGQGSTDPKDSEVSADLSCEILVNVVAARYGGTLVQAGIVPPRVSGSLPQQLTSMGTEMPK